MTKLLKYLKPFAWSILLCVVLVVAQAMCDLKLPDYMSDIVNIGIQQGGVEDAVPEAVRGQTMDHMALFLTQEQQQSVLDHYDVIQSADATAAQKERYPAVLSEPVYVLHSGLTPEERQALSDLMTRPMAMAAGIAEAQSNPGSLQLPEGMALPEGADLYTVLAALPQQARDDMMNQALSQMEALGDSMLQQGAVQGVRAEYTALGMNERAVQNHYIWMTGIKMLLIALATAGSAVAVGFLSSRIGAGLARRLRAKVFRKVESFSNTEFDQFSTASLITRTTNDITQVQMLTTMMLRMVIYAPVMGVGGIIYALSKSVSMSWIIALAVLVLLGLMLLIFLVVMPKFKIVQQLIDRLNLVTRENLSGLMVSRAYNTQEFEEQRFDKANQDLTHVNLFVNRVMTAMMPVMMLIMNAVSLLIIWVGAHQIAQASMQVGDMMAYMQYAMQIVMSFLFICMMFIMIPRASVSAGRVAEVLGTHNVVRDPEHPQSFDRRDRQGYVEFQDVSFRFPGAEEDALSHISFTAKPGETTAIIGATGSGKSALVNLIPRFYDATQGSIRVNGRDVREVAQHELREQIGYVPQKGVLFSGTIASNLKFGDEQAAEDAVRQAAEVAQATDFILQKDDGFDAAISQGGTNVSGGQKQRLSIARALVKQPPIYIFDDSFSALDFKTDAALRRALKQTTGDSTQIIVAQRVGTIRHAEQILVLDEGKLVGMGTHETLMQSCEAYREIAYSQLREEELA